MKNGPRLLFIDIDTPDDIGHTPLRLSETPIS
jgi:hypothetical protein